MLQSDNRHTFEAAWQKQLAYNTKIKAQVENQDWTGTLVLALMEECSELLQATRWKKHRKPMVLRDERSKGNSQAQLEELADIFKCAMSIAQHLGYSAKELLQAVELKSDAMAMRLEQEFAPMPTGCKVLITDLDGTLADFVSGLTAYLGIQISEPSSVSFDVSGQLAYPQYWYDRRVWEEDGGYRTLAAYPETVDLVRMAQRAGVYIIAVTARPKELKRVWLESLQWLLGQDIHPGRLILGESERVLLIQKLQDLDCSVVLLEDDPTLIHRAAPLCPVLVRTQKYNADLSGHNIYHTAKFDPLNLMRLWDSECRGF